MLKKQISILTLFIFTSLSWNNCNAVRRDLNSDITYEKGNVGFRVPKSTKETMHSFENLSYESYDEPYESIVNSKDGRTKVTDTNLHPYSFQGQLITTFEDGTVGYGSGTVVGNHHVLTAGHNIYHSKYGWAKSVKFIPGLNEHFQPFGEVHGARIYTFKNWVGKRLACNDIALVILDQSIGKKTGRAELLLSEDGSKVLGETIEVSGYPEDKNPSKEQNKWQMWTMTSKVKGHDCHRIFYDIDTFKGQSGSGILINHTNHYCLIGVHVRGEENHNKLSSGVRLSNSKIKKIIEWISETKYFSKNLQSTYSHTPSFSTFKLPFNIDYEKKIGANVSEAFSFFKAITDPEHFEALSDYLVKEANKYAMTDGYQTKDLRELSIKNFKLRFNMLKVASILGKRSDADLLIKKENESKQYSYENYDAFLSVDEDLGKKYTSMEEQEIKKLFQYQVEYIKNLLSFNGERDYAI